MLSAKIGILSNNKFKLALFITAIVIIFIAVRSILSLTPEEIIDLNGLEDETTTTVTYVLSGTEVKTYKGLVNLEELNNKVFKPLGYEIIDPTLPVPTLRMDKFKEPICSTVFSEYLENAEGTFRKLDGQSDESFKFHDNDFLMNGFSAFNRTNISTKVDKRETNQNYWNKISEMMELSKGELAKIVNNSEIESLFSALRMFSVDGMNGLVIGSALPWVEVMALQNGAQKVLTVESNALVIEEEYTDRLSSMHPIEFANKWGMYTESFDFAVSFAFVERSGLGFYRDPIDPIGDLRDVMKIKCVLKQGAILYLGLPYGIDALQHHSHRIYGPLRLAMMFTGFKWIGTFSEKSPKPIQLNSRRRHPDNLFNPIRYTFVLQKL